MIRFLLKGLLRDYSRSFFPILVITLGVGIVVFLHAYMGGVTKMLVDVNANFNTGHVKIETRAAVKENQRALMDLALLDTAPLLAQVRAEYQDMRFVERVYFGGLLDLADEEGETIKQSATMGIGVDIFSPENEVATMNFTRSIVKGRLPKAAGEILMAAEFFDNLGINLGQQVTVISSDVEGGMAIANFTVVGSIRFGVSGMDRSMIIVDITDLQDTFALNGGATEILGFFKDGNYHFERALEVETLFNQARLADQDEFAPTMRRFEAQNELGSLLKTYQGVSGMINGIFIFLMAILLWNTGLMSGIRRYGEMGVRLAMGEKKSKVYLSLLAEGMMVGVVGTFIGTLIGLIPAYYMQEVGINIEGMMQNEMAMLFANEITAMITKGTYFAGLIPGLVAPLIGSAMSGMATFKRDTSRLFVELEG